MDVAEQRLAEAQQGLNVRRREQWGSRFDYRSERPCDTPASYVFVHIALVYDRSDVQGDHDTVMRRVEQIGAERFPRTGISYNAAVFDTGALYEGQPVGRRGAHTVNDDRRARCDTPGCPSRGGRLWAPSYNLNVNARAVVLPQMEDDEVTDEQLDGAARLIAGWRRGGILVRTAPIHGHRCVSDKACPGGKMWARMGELDQLAARYTANPPNEEDEVVATVSEIVQALKTGWKARMRAGAYKGRELGLADAISFTHERVVQLGARQAAQSRVLTGMSRALAALAAGQRLTQQQLADLQAAVAELDKPDPPVEQ